MRENDYLAQGPRSRLSWRNGESVAVAEGELTFRLVVMTAYNHAPCMIEPNHQTVVPMSEPLLDQEFSEVERIQALKKRGATP